MNKTFDLQAALMIALACSVMTAISTALSLPYGFLSVITTFVLLLLFYHEIYATALQRLVGALFALGMMTMILTVFQSSPITYTLLMLIAVYLFAYLFACGYLPYAMLIGSITLAIATAEALNNGITAGITLGIYWVLNIVLGVFVSLLFYLLNEKLSGHPIQLRQSLSHTLKLELRTNHAIKALQIFLAIISILIINQCFGWKAYNMQAVIAAAIVAAQPSTYHTHHRAISRFVGVAIGGAVAIFYAHLLRQIPYEAMMIVLQFIALFCICLLKNVSPIIEYGCLQAGIMLPLILMSSAPSYTSYTLAIERTAGSLEGAFIALFYFYLFLILDKKRQHATN